jgi:heptaprenyl diphosphate synthase
VDGEYRLLMAPSPLLEVPSVQGDLERVEVALRRSVEADDPFLTQVASHLIEAGGKRGRPAFAIGAAATGAPTMVPVAEEVVLGAVSVELVHLGSLYHDDVMDEATTRRTVESVNAKWGNLQAILAGDYLLAKASGIAASLGTEVAGLLAATIGRLCEGQVLELQDTYNAGRTEDRYYGSIAGKTASLYASACRIGAIVADLPRPSIDALTEFGLAYGMAFQIVDDVLDLCATDEQLGKPAGHDLIEGVYTLPVIRALVDDPELADQLGRVLTDEEMHQVRDRVRASGQIESTIEAARDRVDDAHRALEVVGPSAAVELLGGAAGHLLTSVTAIAASVAA